MYLSYQAGQSGLHLPEVQHWPLTQSFPQAPQWVALTLRSTLAPHIAPLQTQLPRLQDSAAPHACPQAPQE